MLALAAVAGIAGSPRVYTVEDGATAPRVIQRTAPEYTDQARLARLTGSVLVKLIVEEDGTLRDVHVSRSLGLGLDQKAVEAVESWEFAPGNVDGKAVPVLTTVAVNFQLLTGRSDWHMTRAWFDGPPRGLETADYKPSPGPPAYAEVGVSFEIDAHGIPRNLRVEKSTGAKWEAEILAMLANWRFDPGAPSHATLGFARGKSSV